MHGNLLSYSLFGCLIFPLISPPLQRKRAFVPSPYFGCFFPWPNPLFLYVNLSYPFADTPLPSSCLEQCLSFPSLLTHISEADLLALLNRVTILGVLGKYLWETQWLLSEWPKVLWSSQISNTVFLLLLHIFPSSQLLAPNSYSFGILSEFVIFLQVYSFLQFCPIPLYSLHDVVL